LNGVLKGKDAHWKTWHLACRSARWDGGVRRLGRLARDRLQTELLSESRSKKEPHLECNHFQFNNRNILQQFNFPGLLESKIPYRKDVTTCFRLHSSLRSTATTTTTSELDFISYLLTSHGNYPPPPPIAPQTSQTPPKILPKNNDHPITSTQSPNPRPRPRKPRPPLLPRPSQHPHPTRSSPPNTHPAPSQPPPRLGSSQPHHNPNHQRRPKLLWPLLHLNTFLPRAHQQPHHRNKNPPHHHRTRKCKTQIEFLFYYPIHAKWNGHHRRSNPFRIPRPQIETGVSSSYNISRGVFPRCIPLSVCGTSTYFHWGRRMPFSFAAAAVTIPT